MNNLKQRKVGVESETNSSTSSISQSEKSVASTNGGLSSGASSLLSLSLLSLTPPICVLLLLAGNQSITVLGFGALIAYIFDLLGSVEGTVLSLIITSLTLWITLIFNARSMFESLAANIIVFIFIGLIVLLTLFTILSHFQTLRMEFVKFFYFTETLLFSTIPLVASTILTWFIIAEVPSLDVSLCFSFIYFIYLYILGYPRLTSYNLSSQLAKDPRNHHLCFVLHVDIMKVLYAIPIFISPLICIGVKYNFIKSVKISEIAISILCPILLMILCCEKHINYWASHHRPDVIHVNTILKITTAAIFFVCLQDSSLLYDLKSFSKLNDTMASALLCGIAMLTTLAIGFQSQPSTEEDDNFSRAGFTVKDVLVDLCFGLAGVLSGVLLRIPYIALPIAAVGPVALSQYYQRSNKSSLSLITILHALVAASCASIITFFYGVETVYFYNFEIFWSSYGIFVSLKYFTLIISGFVAFAVLLPMLIYYSSRYYRESNSLDSAETRSELPFSVTTFQMMFSLGCSAFSALELVVREQSWFPFSTTPVYPISMLLLSSVLLVASSVHLYNSGAVRLWVIWSTVISQTMKLTNLFGVPSIDSFAIGALIRAYTLPFLVHCLAPRGQVPFPKHDPYNVPNYLFLFYLCVAGVATFAARECVLARSLSLLSWKDFGIDQQISAGLCIFTLLNAAMMQVFRPQFSFSRSLFVLLSLSFAFITSESISIHFLTQYPFVEINAIDSGLISSGAAYAHLALFVALSVGLALSAASSLLPIKNPVSRLFFAFLFSLCSSRVLLSWGFQYFTSHNFEIGSDVGLTWLSIPSLYCFGFVLLCTFSSLHACQSHTSVVGFILFIVASLMPFIALVVVFFYSNDLDSRQQSFSGIIWTAILSHALIGFSIRFVSFLQDIEYLRTIANKTSSTLQTNPSASSLFSSNNVESARICLSTSLLTITWTIIASFLLNSSSLFSFDLLVPISTLVLLCIRREFSWNDFPPLVFSAIISSIWWFSLAFNSIFIRVDDVIDDPYLSLYGFLKDGKVSIWTSSSLIIPLLHVGLLFCPIPAVYLAFRRFKDQSEEVMFMLAIVSIIPVVASQLNSLRLLGIVGTALGLWRSNDIGVNKKVVNRII